MREELIHNLKRKLREPLPGEPAQYRMAPLGREKLALSALKEGSYRHSAVLILICKKGGQYFIPLIERTSYNGVHSGQISFPGGKYDESDQSLENTAMRECFEEIGLHDSVEIIGSLTQLYIPVSRFLVHPFVGVCAADDPEMRPHEREVKSIVSLSIEQLLRDDFVSSGTVLAGGMTISTPYFDLHGHKIWGATAMVLNELRELLSLVK